MKNQIEQPVLQTVSRADVFTQLPDGSTVEGIKGAFVHFDSRDYKPSRTDVSAKKFLRQLISIREAVKQLDIPDISKPEIRLGLPEARTTQANLHNALWLGNVLLGYDSDIDLIDLDQAHELTSDKSLLRTALRETTADFLIAVEPDSENVSREQQNDMHIVKQMLSSAHVTTLSIGCDTVSLVEPNLMYMEMPTPDARAEYLAVANSYQAVAA